MLLLRWPALDAPLPWLWMLVQVARPSYRLWLCEQVLLPPSAGAELMAQDAPKNGAQLFELRGASGALTHAGVLNFTAPEGCVAAPAHVIRNLVHARRGDAPEAQLAESPEGVDQGRAAGAGVGGAGAIGGAEERGGGAAEAGATPGAGASTHVTVTYRKLPKGVPPWRGDLLEFAGRDCSGFPHLSEYMSVYERTRPGTDMQVATGAASTYCFSATSSTLVHSSTARRHARSGLGAEVNAWAVCRTCPAPHSCAACSGVACCATPVACGERRSPRARRAGEYARLQPAEAGFQKGVGGDVREVLEAALARHSTLSEGDWLDAQYGGRAYALRVQKLRPAAAVSVIGAPNRAAV